MANRAPYDPETQAVMDRLRRRQQRRRQLQIAALVAAAAILVIGLAAAAVAAFTSPQPPTATVAGVSSTTATVLPSSTTNPPGPSQGPTTTRTWPPRPSTTDATDTTDGSEAPTGSATTQTTGRTTDTTKGPSSGSTGSAPAGAVVVIDPGHQRRGDSSDEAIGPGSSTTKDKVTGGTGGVVTGTPESEVVLSIGLKLRDALQAKGIKVIMTRTTQDVNLSNIERTLIANEAQADLYIRVHCDGAENSSTKGIHVLYPAVTAGWTDDIAGASKRAAQLAQAALVRHTGAVDRGIDARDDMTGFNWSDVPAIIPELGFMSNPDEDRLLNSADYQQKIVAALVESTLQFLNEQ